MSLQDNLQKDNKEVMVSVCCATYNHEKYIEKALQGFANQITNFHFEVIVHEDASTDKTREIVKRYVRMYPDIFVPVYQEENQYSKGRGLTFRNMLLKSKGKYIAVCEGDDYWVDEYKLQKQFDVMEANNECSMCVHDISQVYENGQNIQQKQNETYCFTEGIVSKEQLSDILWKEGMCIFHTSSFFIKRSVLQPRIDYTEPFIKYMNGDMVMVRLSMAQGEIYYINEIMSCRRRGVDGSWNLRWGKKTTAEKVQYYKDFAYGEKMYDKYTNYVFHEYIKFYIFTLMSECCVYDTSDVKEYVSEYPLSYKIVKDKETLWMYIRYLILRCSPKFYKSLYEFKLRLEEIVWSKK